MVTKGNIWYTEKQNEKADQIEMATNLLRASETVWTVIFVPHIGKGDILPCYLPLIECDLSPQKRV